MKLFDRSTKELCASGAYLIFLMSAALRPPLDGVLLLDAGPCQADRSIALALLFGESSIPMSATWVTRCAVMMRSTARPS